MLMRWSSQCGSVLFFKPSAQSMDSVWCAPAEPPPNPRLTPSLSSSSGSHGDGARGRRGECRERCALFTGRSLLDNARPTITKPLYHSFLPVLTFSPLHPPAATPAWLLAPPNVWSCFSRGSRPSLFFFVRSRPASYVRGAHTHSGRPVSGARRAGVRLAGTG
jgi:hypothetical protein